MNKKNLLAVILLSLSLLTGCGCSQDNEPSYISFGVPNDWNIQRKESIVSMEFVNVPTDPIEVGYFSQAGIGLKVRYIDNAEKVYDFDESFFPLPVLSTLKTPGEKAFDITFKENHIPLNFTLIKAKQPRKVKATYIDYRGTEVAQTYVNYLDDAVYTGEDIPSYQEDGGINVWNGLFDGRYYNLYRDETLVASYEYRPYGYYLDDMNNQPQRYEMIIGGIGRKNNNDVGAFYFARMKRVVLDGSEFVYHNKGFFDKTTYNNPTFDININNLGDKVLTSFIEHGYVFDGSGLTVYHGNNKYGRACEYTMVNLNKFNLSKDISTFKATAFDSVSPTPKYISSGDNSSVDLLYSEKSLNAIKDAAKAGHSTSIYHDYKSGYYCEELVADVDLYLVVEYQINNPKATSYTFEIKNVKVIPCLKSVSVECTYYKNTNEPKWINDGVTVTLDNHIVWQTIWRSTLA